MNYDHHDYTERLSGWNRSGNVAVDLLNSMTRTEDDRDLLAVDWRNAQDVKDIAIFIARIGLESCESGMPIHDGGLFNVHKTHKDKIFFDFITKVEEGLSVLERRIYLPEEDMVVISLFRATRDKLPK